MEKAGQPRNSVAGSEVDRKWQKKLAALEEKAKFYQEHHLVPEYKPRLRDPSPFWKEFYRQKGAIDTAVLDKEDVHVFAYEPRSAESPDTPSTGKRKYVVTSYSELWHHIQNRFKHQQPATFYEVIPEGAACKLYFDLEYQKKYNPMHDGRQMVESLIEIVCQKLQESFHISCSSKDVMVFDASTDTKFSSHLIFNLKSAAFKDNIHAGNFVHHLCDGLRRLQSTDANEVPCIAKKPRLNEDETTLFVLDQNDKISLFIDEGVYTKNRNFRLYKCIKLGKNNPLLVADYNKFELKQPKRKIVNKDKEIFMESLITNIKCTSNTKVLTFESSVRESNISTSPQSSPGSTNKEGYRTDPSPFSDLDDFIKTVVTKGNVQGNIRRWVYFAECGTMLYDIIGNRWCENIKRAHKSNNIMILVNLKRRIFYQKCHDPDCKRIDYKSAELPLPVDCLPQIEDYEDEELLRALEMVDNGSKGDMYSSTVSIETTCSSTETINVAVAEEDITDEEFSEVYNKLLESQIVSPHRT
ncbi:putative DNA-directed primase/polymerase protein [Apostichopus japonicus]|uniref:DNA-directed primase/polymerase protein n=1 Tax=Stichopus japonicus TaxID=307972 RepID=A0A2G8K981_STIJA|nr:putative DNA-directed primase/polymerase protein [Apostichopus japonicus]